LDETGVEDDQNNERTSKDEQAVENVLVDKIVDIGNFKFGVLESRKQIAAGFLFAQSSVKISKRFIAKIVKFKVMIIRLNGADMPNFIRTNVF
jgi:hypothetical protein